MGFRYDEVDELFTANLREAVERLGEGRWQAAARAAAAFTKKQVGPAPWRAYRAVAAQNWPRHYANDPIRSGVFGRLSDGL